jgi:Fe-S oxidoreductase
MVGKRMVEGVSALTLASDGGVEVAFVPGAGMVGCSLRHRGEENIYAKLDAHSRAEAVERARELGLLAPSRIA